MGEKDNICEKRYLNSLLVMNDKADDKLCE